MAKANKLDPEEEKWAFTEELLKDAPTFKSFLKENNWEFKDFVMDLKNNLTIMQNIKDPVRNFKCNSEFISFLARTPLSPGVLNEIMKLRDQVQIYRTTLEQISRMSMDDWPEESVFCDIPLIPVEHLKNHEEKKIDDPVDPELPKLLKTIQKLEAANETMEREVETNNQKIEKLSTQVLKLKRLFKKMSEVDKQHLNVSVSDNKEEPNASAKNE